MGQRSTGIVLEQVPLSRACELREGLSAYLLEFAQLEQVPPALDPDGSPAYAWFGSYWRDPGRLPFFVVADGSVVGFCLVRVVDRGWNVAEFGVRPEARRRGIGRAAVAALAYHATAAGASHVRADVHLWNDRARRFWHACGFADLEQRGEVVTTLLRLAPGSSPPVDSREARR